jgi:hypothetical protein
MRMVLAEFSHAHDFKPWQRPSRSALALRAISRHIEALGVEHTRAFNRLHAAQGSMGTPRCVIDDMKRSLATLERRILEAAARGQGADRQQRPAAGAIPAADRHAGDRGDQRVADTGRAGACWRRR